MTFDLRAKTINVWFDWKSNSACSENTLKIGFSVLPYLCTIWHIDRKLLNHKRTLEKNRSKLLENSRVLDSKYVFELTTEHSEILHISYSYIFELPWYLSIRECVPKKGLGKNQTPFCRDSNCYLPLASKPSNNSTYV